MDGRTLFGALVRTIGFGMALFEAVQIVLQAVQLAAIAIVASRQPGSGDAASAAIQQAAIPLLVSVILCALGLLLVRRGDSIATWAYSERRSRRAAAAIAAASAKEPASAKPARRRAPPSAES
jgi:hypothetical protein